MVAGKKVRELALTLPQVTEAPHFEKDAYKVKGKIFLTHNKKETRICVRLSAIDQDVFSKIHPAVSPVPNKWGSYGWTLLDLKTSPAALFRDIVKTAYAEALKKKA